MVHSLVPIVLLPKLMRTRIKMSTYQKGSTHQKGEEPDDGDGNFNDPGEAYDDEPRAKLPRPPVKNAHYNGSMSGALMDDTHIFSAIASSSGEDEAGAEAGVEVAAEALNLFGVPC